MRSFYTWDKKDYGKTFILDMPASGDSVYPDYILTVSKDEDSWMGNVGCISFDGDERNLLCKSFRDRPSAQLACEMVFFKEKEKDLKLTIKQVNSFKRHLKQQMKRWG